MLEVESIDTWRGPAQVLRRVSLKVGGRESVCLVGRNGAGKTTTIDSIIGLLPVRGGKVVFQGKEVGRIPPYQRARMGIGYAPEDAGLFTDLTVSENFQVCRWMAEASDRKDQISDEETDRRIFTVFPEMRKFTGRRALFLSGGEKKMVAIARAMALSPSVLLLDEPFEGLAPVVVTRFIEAVKKIKEMGISILIAESNLANAVRVADRLYAIDRGEIIYQGDPRQVYENEEVMKTIRG
jgi:branched-chain amino acid transport system ATP-binding protein